MKTSTDCWKIMYGLQVNKNAISFQHFLTSCNTFKETGCQHDQARTGKGTEAWLTEPRSFRISKLITMALYHVQMNLTIITHNLATKRMGYSEE